MLRLTLLCLSLAGLTGLAGCSSLPLINPDTLRASGGARQAVQLHGARGALSAAQSTAVLERLKSRGTASNIFDRHLAVEEVWEYWL